MTKWRMKRPAVAGATSDDAQAAQVVADGKAAASDAPVPAPATATGELVISVAVHCEGCARKLRRSVLRLQGVEEVSVDCWTNTVVVRGPKTVENPAKVVEIVERKTRKKALLLTQSLLKPPLPAANKVEVTNKYAAHGEMNKEMDQQIMEMAVVLRMDLHCEACSEEIKRRILKIKGVEEAVPHITSSQVAVKGMVEPATLAGLVHKCTARKAAIIRAEPLEDPLPLPPKEAPPMELVETPAPRHGDTKHDKEEQKKEIVQEENIAEEVQGKEGNAKIDHDPNEAPNNVVTEENNAAKNHLCKFPAPAAVFAVAAPEGEKMAMNSLYQCCYYPPAYPYAYPSYQYQYPQQNVYAGNYPTAVYGYDPQGAVPEAFSDENPNACTIM